MFSKRQRALPSQNCSTASTIPALPGSIKMSCRSSSAQAAQNLSWCFFHAKIALSSHIKALTGT